MEEPKMEEKKEDIVSKTNDLLNLNEIEDLIKSNEKIFELNNISYRIQKPNFKQKQEVYKKRIEKYTEFLKDDKYLLEKDLKEIYKKRGIDLDLIDSDLKNRIIRRDEFMLKLGEEIKNNSPEDVLKLLKNEIELINSEIQELSIKKSMLLEVSIEQQLNIFMYTYFTYLLLEEKEGENWVRVWDTYEEYENGNSEVINLASYYVTMMVSFG